MNHSKAAHMTKDEAMLLVELIAAKKIIYNKSTDATSNKLKEEAWTEVSKLFNSSITSFPRTATQLRLKWDNLKKSARKRCAAIRSSSIKTRGGREYFPPDELLDKVASLLDNSRTRVPVDCDGDVTEATSAKNFVPSESDTDDVNTDFIEDISGSDSVDVSHNYQTFETHLQKQRSGSVIAKRRKIEEESKARISMCELSEAVIEDISSNMVEDDACDKQYLFKRRKMEEEKHKAQIARENALTEYLLAKKKIIDLDLEEKELVISKLKLELENAKLKNIKLKTELNL